MAKYNKPREGSLAYYPRVRAKKQTPSFALLKDDSDQGKALNFLGYKVGMTHIIGVNEKKKTVTSGQVVFEAATVVEVPPVRVFGVRAYKKFNYGIAPLGDVLIDKANRDLVKQIRNFLTPSPKKDKKDAVSKKEESNKKEKLNLDSLETKKEQIVALTLLVHSQPRLAGLPKKKPDVFEVSISGNVDIQLAFAKEKLGKEIMVEEVINKDDFLDIKAVTKGKGYQGVIKRFGVKIQRPKAKKQRIVGSIGPWNPSVVMWTVPRPGQMGYHNRTEFNKKVLMISNNPTEINVNAGFKNYGEVKSSFILIKGSIPGPAKRAVALRRNVRIASSKTEFGSFKIIGVKGKVNTE